MDRCISIVFSLIAFSSLTINQAFAQQEVDTIKELECSIQEWALGDVAGLDLESNRLVLVNIDYDSGEEKEITISVDARTNYKNVISLQDIKPGDVLAIDYEVNPEAEGECKATALTIAKIGDGSL